MLKKFSDNALRDLGIANADEEKAKVEAVALILREMKARDWRAADLAKACDVPASNVSEILNLKLERYSIDRLNKVLRVFGKQVVTSYALETAR